MTLYYFLVLNLVFHVMFLPKEMDRQVATEVFEKYNDAMARTQLTPEMKKHEEVLFEVFIEKTTGKPYSEYLKEQRAMKRQIRDLEKMAEEANRLIEQEKQRAEEEKQRAEEAKKLIEQEKQRALEDNKKAIYELSKMLAPAQIATALKMPQEEIEKIIAEQAGNKTT